MMNHRRKRPVRVPTYRCKRTGKVAYRSEDDAYATLERRVQCHAGERRAYECDACRGWHLTSLESHEVELPAWRVGA